MKQINRLSFGIFLVVLMAGSTASVFANTAIETETAQIGLKGNIGISQSIEYAKGKDGYAYGTLTQFEYAISDRSEILIEPFFHLWEVPSEEDPVDGPGDLEITPSYMVVTEKSWVPAVLLAFKLKVPTGSTNVGGSGKFDYYPYLIFGQHFKGFTFNTNLGVNFVTPEDGGALEHAGVWDFEVERNVFSKVTLFWEVFSAEDAVKTVSTAAQYQFTQHFNAFVAVGYTEDDEVILRPGFNLEF